ncbi:unnamed protein product [Ilex paraguariensis]
MEMMEAEAKDSDEEAEEIATKQYEQRNVLASPQNLQMGMKSPHNSVISKQEVSKNLLTSSPSQGFSNVGHTCDIVSGIGKETKSDEASYLYEIHNKHSEVLVSLDVRTPRGVSCIKPSDPCDAILISPKSGNGFASTPGSAEKSDAAKLSAISYSRKTPRTTTPSMFPGDKVKNMSSACALNTGKLDVSESLNISSSVTEQDGIILGCAEIPLGETELHAKEGHSGTLPEKRKINVSDCSSKSQKIIHNPAHFSEHSLLVNRSGGLGAASLPDGTLEATNHLFLGDNAHCMDEIAALNPSKDSPNISRQTSVSFYRKLGTCDRPISNTVSSEMRKDGSGKEVPQGFIMESKETILDCKPGSKDAGVSGVEHFGGEVGLSQKELQDIEVSSPITERLEIRKSNSPANLDLLKGGNDSHSKTYRKKMIAKKRLGSKPNSGTGCTANQKGSIYLNKTARTNDVEVSSAEEKVTAESIRSEKFEMDHPSVNVVTAIDIEATCFPKYGNEATIEALFMDDETEAPEDKEEKESKAAECEGKSGRVEPVHEVHMDTEEKSEGVHNSLGMYDHGLASGKNQKEIETENLACSKKTDLSEPTDMENAGKEKVTRGKKGPFSKTKKKILPTVRKVTNSNECNDGEGAKHEKNNKKTVTEKVSMPYAACESKRAVPANKSEDSNAAEKENRPTGVGDHLGSHGKQRAGKVPSKSKMSLKNDIKVGGMDLGSVQMGRTTEVKKESAWFILSGHKLQRKEFQQVIKRLKGRVCRDSHQWSYQATHFIVPDPIRRTEKLFAAAAAGRWILKTDYLAASNQAGRFLAEEPYEWHKNGLSEDGAINLQAPRKWRLLREKTGHGAFYGMRIIIYGDCIAPPLDTLKRVLKAGDGTILATSPPYTRFLELRVDFAIVSPGMPRVDIWVQEFLRNEIPCVLADYLVEYVCKPGYSLDRHVQYNTHAWAEKSFKDQVNRLEEVVDDLTPSEDHVDNDLPCQVCGSCDRGEVMLICGDESGSSGCGVGTHIDCCDPPLEAVPEEDWCCPKCSTSKNSKNPSKSTKKGSSLSKKK